MKHANTSEPSDKLQALPKGALLRLSTLRDWGLLPLSRSTLWRKIRVGHFPAPIKVSAGVTAWRADEIRCWLDDPSAYRTPNARSSGRP